jgi:hypothetical protein
VGSGDLSSFFIGEISPKREIENKILKKWSDFLGFQSPEVSQKTVKINRLLYWVFGV